MGYLNRLLEKAFDNDGIQTLGLYEINTQHGINISVEV